MDYALIAKIILIHSMRKMRSKKQWRCKMNFFKELWIEEYDQIMADAEESGIPIDDNKAGELAHQRSIDRFADMCDEAKDRAKYSEANGGGNG